MLTTADANVGWRRGLVIGLTLLSLAIPLFAIFFRDEPTVSFADPARMTYYRQTLAAPLLGLVCALAAFVGTRSVPSPVFRRLSLVLLSASVLLSAYLLWTLIGSCGLQILWGSCQP